MRQFNISVLALLSCSKPPEVGYGNPPILFSEEATVIELLAPLTALFGPDAG